MNSCSLNATPFSFFLLVDMLPVFIPVNPIHILKFQYLKTVSVCVCAPTIMLYIAFITRL